MENQSKSPLKVEQVFFNHKENSLMDINDGPLPVQLLKAKWSIAGIKGLGVIKGLDIVTASNIMVRSCTVLVATTIFEGKEYFF